MNHKHAIGAAALAAAALGAGYMLGARAPEGTPVNQVAQGQSSQNAKSGERKVLFYRNPMGLPDTSPVPKKDPMGMNYIPVYEGEEPASTEANEIKISTEKVQKLGVRTERAAMRTLDRQIRAAGRIEPDERRTYAISPKFEGYVERLHVNVTGQPVAKGQPLFEVYSPELVSAQREYAIAIQGLESLKESSEDVQSGMRQLADASLVRLKNWDISDEQIKALSRTTDTRRTLTFRSPVSGIVSEKKAVQGMRFEPGEALYQITDLSSVWVVADVFEQDIGQVRPGSKASVAISAYPDKRFEGTVSYVYPTLNAETRTVPVRVELRNPQLLLKPAMFAQVELAVGGAAAVLTVPTSAVIDSGTRALVLVQRGEGRFEPRDVTLGARGQQYVQILSGLKADEEVVVAANFLIDAESNLKAAVGGFGHAGHGASAGGGSAATPNASAPLAPAGGQAASGSVTHRAQGQIDAVDAASGTVTLQHGAIGSLKWPAMTMDFQLAHGGLASGLARGQQVDFEFVERAPGEYVVTKITARGKPVAAPANNTHSGH